MKNKRILLSAALVLAAFFNLHAQTKSKFSFDLGLNYNNTTNLSNREWGGGIFFNPKYSLTDHFKLGLKLQGDFLWDRKITQSGNDHTVDLINAFQATADYHFGKGKVKPYAGIAAGFFEQHFLRGTGITETIYDTDKGQSLGIAPIVGVTVNRWFLQAAYNMSVRRSCPKYVSIGLGYTIGGTR